MFVRGAARDAAEAAGAEEGTGTSEDEWWNERAPVLDQVMTAERIPTLARLADEGGFDVPADTINYNVRFVVDDFEFGLQRLLDGIERHVVASRDTSSGSRLRLLDKSEE
jgi:hypothetical protein